MYEHITKYKHASDISSYMSGLFFDLLIIQVHLKMHQAFLQLVVCADHFGSKFSFDLKLQKRFQISSKPVNSQWSCEGLTE